MPDPYRERKAPPEHRVQLCLLGTSLMLPEQTLKVTLGFCPSSLF